MKRKLPPFKIGQHFINTEAVEGCEYFYKIKHALCQVSFGAMLLISTKSWNRTREGALVGKGIHAACVPRAAFYKHFGRHWKPVKP